MKGEIPVKKFGLFISGLIVGSILFGSAMCFAAYGKKNVVAEYSNIKIVLDGGLVNSSTEPFMLDGRVYVPLRMVAEAMGKQVGWENNTVLIGSAKQSLVLNDLIKPSETGLTCTSGTNSKVNETTYPRGFYAIGKKDFTNSDLSFFVRGKGIKEVNGSIGLDDSNPDGAEVGVKVLTDSKKIWEGTIKKGQNPVPVNIKLENNVNNIKFEFKNSASTRIDFIDFSAKY